MKTTKKCPQCNQDFVGQSKRLYCSDRCKVEAFRAGKTRPVGDILTAVQTLPVPFISVSEPSKQPRSMSRTYAGQSSKVELDIRRLEFDHARQMKLMDLEEAERLRRHEQDLARIKADEIGREAQLQRLTQQVAELSQKAILPLDEWSYYPLGIKRQYQAFVQAAFEAEEKGTSSVFYQEWVDEYGLYKQAVQALITGNGIPVLAHKPFMWLTELAHYLEQCRRSLGQAGEQQRSLPILSPALRHQLTRACL